MFNDICTLLSAFVGACMIVMFFSWAYFGLRGMWSDMGRRAAEAQIRKIDPSNPHLPADPPEEPDGALMDGFAVGFGTTIILMFVMYLHPLGPNIVEMNRHWPWWFIGPEIGVIYYIHKKVGGKIFLLVLAMGLLQGFVMIETNNPDWDNNQLFEIVRGLGDWFVSLIRAPFELVKRLLSK